MKTPTVPYSFCTLRYVHDITTGEFVNVGVVLYSPEARFIGARFTTRYTRLNNLFLQVDGEQFRALIRFIQNRFDSLSNQFANELPLNGWPKDVLAAVACVLPHDDSALQWASPGSGITEDPSVALGRLYARLVEHYMESTDSIRTDKDAWQLFHTEFQRHSHVLHQLREKRIETPRYQYTFHHAWKNGVWNVYEPLTFDLKEERSILEKGSHWVGRLVSLNKSSEKFKVHFLVERPSVKSLHPAFDQVRELLIQDSPGNPELIIEKDAASFSDRLAKEIPLAA